MWCGYTNHMNRLKVACHCSHRSFTAVQGARQTDRLVTEWCAQWKETCPCHPKVAFFLLKEWFRTLHSLFVLFTSSNRKNLSPLLSSATDRVHGNEQDLRSLRHSGSTHPSRTGTLFLFIAFTERQIRSQICVCEAKLLDAIQHNTGTQVMEYATQKTSGRTINFIRKDLMAPTGPRVLSRVCHHRQLLDHLDVNHAVAILHLNKESSQYSARVNLLSLFNFLTDWRIFTKHNTTTCH